MSYIDGFILAVPTNKRAEYIAFSHDFVQIFKDHGATRVVECWGDDVPDGALTSFPKSVQASPDETVVFCWNFWPSKAARDAASDAMQNDPRMAMMTPDKMPFDGARVIFGGFEVIIDA